MVGNMPKMRRADLSVNLQPPTRAGPLASDAVERARENSNIGRQFDFLVGPPTERTQKSRKNSGGHELQIDTISSL